MNILIINHYAGSPRHGMEHRPYMLAREWTKSGHGVTVVAGSYSHLRTRNPARPNRLTTEIIDGIRYVWLHTPEYHGNGLRRVFNIAAFVTHLYRADDVLLEPRPDVVIASSTYPFDVFPARRLATRVRARFVYEVHDLWPLTPKELGHFPAWHPFILAAQFAEDQGYRSADAVISLLPGTLPYMQSRGLPANKFRWIPNGIALREENHVPRTGRLPQSQANLLAQLRHTGQFIVGYAGGHSLSNALDTLVGAASLTTGEGIAYVLIGDGPEKARLVEKKGDLQLDNVHFLPRVGSDAIPEFLASVDVAYLGWHDSRLYRFGISPNKLFDYMAAGVPIVHSVRAFNDPVKESGCGISIPPGDQRAIAEAVRSLRGMNAADRAAIGDRGRRYVEAHHDYGVLARRFLEFVAPRESQP